MRNGNGQNEKDLYRIRARERRSMDALLSQQEMAAKPAGLSRAPILTNSYYSRQRSYRHEFSKNLTLAT